VVGGLTKRYDTVVGWVLFFPVGSLWRHFQVFFVIFFFVCLNHALCNYHSLTRVVYSITHMSHVFIFNYHNVDEYLWTRIVWYSCLFH
jgi:hypothetical protein